jgi:hypothetical protein
MTIKPMNVGRLGRVKPELAAAGCAGGLQDAPTNRMVKAQVMTGMQSPCSLTEMLESSGL